MFTWLSKLVGKSEVWLYEGVPTDDRGSHTTFEICRSAGAKVFELGVGGSNFHFCTDEARNKIRKELDDAGYTFISSRSEST